jgi:antitoxin PrlF
VDETRMRVNENGRIVIPANCRKALGIEPGDEVVLSIEDGELRISTVESRLREAQAAVRRYIKPDKFLSDELIAERREAARDE